MMKFSTTDAGAACRNTQARISDYIDSNLSAREVLDVEGHLTRCGECSALARQMQTTVDLLRSAPMRDTGNDFMANLHARLDVLKPEPAHGSGALQAMRDWLRGLREPILVRRLPALGLSLGVVAAVIFFARPITPAPQVTQVPVSGHFAAPLSYNVALTASNPFDDPAAANLEAASARRDSGLTTETQ